MAINLTDPVSPLRRSTILASCALAVGLLIAGERLLGPAVPIGGFFLLPLAVAAAYVSRGSIFALALVTAIAREFLGRYEPGPDAVQRVAVSMVAFVGGGLFAGELVRNRRITLQLLHKTQQEMRFRADAEQESRALVESSPAGVLTVDSKGKIAMANAAARRLLGFTENSPEGEPVERYIPLLARLLQSKQVVNLTRTAVDASGKSRTGEAFFSQAWVSAYTSAAGPRLAVILLDMTDQIRDREESGLKQLLSNSRIVAGAVSHELRNLAAAGSVLHLNLARQGILKESADFQALGSVIESVLRLSSTELTDSSEDILEGIDVGDLLDELRTIISPTLEEAGVTADWEVRDDLPGVRANHSGLLQVFLNLAKNSCAVLRDRVDGHIRITAYELAGSVVMRFSDNGPGISSAERLFQPFQAGASSTGLGLFVSRAVIRTFGGELHHTQQAGECSFIIELPAVKFHV